MQLSRHRPGTLPRSAFRRPQLFQRRPHRSPILRRRFHDDFFDLLGHQPLGQLPQLTRARAHLPTQKLVFPIHCDVRNHDCKHPLVYINSANSVSHLYLLGRSRARAQQYIIQALGLSPRQRDTTPTYSLNNAHAGSTNSSVSTSPLARRSHRSVPATVSQMRDRFS